MIFEHKLHGSHEGYMLKAEDLRIESSTGETFQGVVLLDKFGNPTDLLYDSMSLLAKDEDDRWVEVNMVQGSWVRPFIH